MSFPDSMLKPLNIFKEECSTMFYSKELTFNTKNIVLVPGRVFENIIDKKKCKHRYLFSVLLPNYSFWIMEITGLEDTLKSPEIESNDGNKRLATIYIQLHLVPCSMYWQETKIPKRTQALQKYERTKTNCMAAMKK